MRNWCWFGWRTSGWNIPNRSKRFLRSLLMLDTVSAHKTDPVKEEMFANITYPVQVPEGCTSKVQPLDVSINRPFKLVLGECWEKYTMNIIETLLPEMISDPTCKFLPPSRQHIVDWVLEGHNYLLFKKKTSTRSHLMYARLPRLLGSPMRNDKILRKDNGQGQRRSSTRRWRWSLWNGASIFWYLNLRSFAFL